MVRRRWAQLLLRATFLTLALVLAVGLAGFFYWMLTPAPVDLGGGGLTRVTPLVPTAPPAATSTASPPSSPSAPPATPSPSAQPSIAPSPSARPSPSPGPSAAASPSPTGPLVHVVLPGENLTGIAARYGVTVQAIVAANGILDPDVIEIGQSLLIPPAP